MDCRGLLMLLYESSTEKKIEHKKAQFNSQISVL